MILSNIVHLLQIPSSIMKIFPLYVIITTRNQLQKELFNMPTKEINGVNIYYELKGESKETVAFLNGVAMSTPWWEPQVKAVKDNYNVLLHDFRGQGQSTLEPNNFTFEQHADDFYELLEELEIDKVHIVGVSYGAEVAMVFALKYPEKISSLLLGTAVSEVRPLLKAKIEAWILASKTYNGKLFFKVMAPYVYSNSFYEKKGEWLEDRAEKFGEIVTKEWFDAFIALCENFLTLDITDKLSEIDIPTLVVSAEEDILKPPLYGQIIHNQIDNSVFKVIEGSGHGLFAEKPVEFNETIIQFIENNSN